MNVGEFEITSRVEELRKERGWTQATLSAESGVTQGTISRIEGGNTRFEIAHLVALAAALDTTIEGLFEITKKDA